jgi:D-xylose 1-dehydrogenase (NADP+, D-xylono-1,5-lactone-forming)
MTKVRWGLLSTANIGRVAAEATRQANHSEFVAVASRDAARARDFADEMGFPLSFGSYEELLASDNVEAIYIALPVSMHTEWTIKAVQAGKHVLCEKPFAMTAVDADRCFDAAEEAGKLCVEGFMYRHHPQTILGRRLIADGVVGELAYIRAALSVDAAPSDIRRSVELGGGALLDLGCYCVSAIRLFAGQPERVYAERVRDGPGGVDLRFAASLRMPNGVLAQFDAGLDLPRRDEFDVLGTDGRLTIPDPWLCRPGYIELEREGKSERLDVDPAGAFRLTRPDLDAYRIEFEATSAAIQGRGQPPFGRADAVAQAQVLEALHRSSVDAAPVGPHRMNTLGLRN